MARNKNQNQNQRDNRQGGQQQATQKQFAGNAPNQSGSGQSQGGSVYGGMYNFGAMMDDFFKNDGETEESRLMKNAFQGNMLQSSVDSQLAMMLGNFNQGIAQENMLHQADLEMRNQQGNMKLEAQIGQETMNSQFEFQNQFADDQHRRDVGMLGATGEQQRKNIEQQGLTDQQTAIIEAEQTNKTLGVQGDQERQNIVTQGVTDLNKISAEGIETRNNIVQQGGIDISKIREQGDIEKDLQDTKGEQALDQIGASGDQDVRKIGAQGNQDRETLGVKGEQDRLNIGAQGDQDVRKIESSGSQDRLTQDNETRNTAKDRANQYKYAKGGARNF